MQILDKVLVKFGHRLGLPSRYKLLKKIGAGAEGEVWMCLDEQSRSMVAIKLVPRGAPAWQLNMARREFSMLARLGPSHLNIVRPLEIVLTSKYLALVTEYVSGGSLSDFLARHGLCEDVARYYFRQLVAAVAFCHSRKMVYRDLKPANVLLTGTHPPFLKLCDFGLADSWEGQASPTFKSLVGTPGYMCPDIMASFFTGAAELARRSRDVAAAATGRSVSPFAAAAADARTAAAAGTAAGPAADTKPKGGRPPVQLKPSASGKLTSAVAAAAAAAAAAARAAVAAVPGSRSNSFGSGGATAAAAAAAVDAADAEAELNNVQSYNGEAADVFSLGVLLVVMVLRRMPWHYDLYAERLPLLKAMKALYDMQVVHRVSWREATPGADTLSEPLAALLDGMLQPDPARRITLAQVTASDWFNGPLPRKLECALEVISEQQLLQEQQYNAAAAAAAAEGDDSAAGLGLSPAVQQQLDEMLEAAKTVERGFKLQSRLILTRPHRHQSPARKSTQPPESTSQQPLQPQPLAPAPPQQQQAAGDEDGLDKDIALEECCTAAIITSPRSAVVSEASPGTTPTAAVVTSAARGKGALEPAPVDVTVQVV